jgi:hypothetical protein
MLSIPQPVQTPTSLTNSCPLTEDSQTIIGLLRLIYPCQGLLPLDTPVLKLHRLLQASMKYSLDSVTLIVVTHMEKWMRSTGQDWRAMHAYASASALGAEDLAREATVECLKRGLNNLVRVEPSRVILSDELDSTMEGAGEILQEVSGADIYRLTIRCSIFVSQLKEELLKARSWDFEACRFAYCSSWASYLEHVSKKIDEYGPSMDYVFTSSFISFCEIDERDGCGRSIGMGHQPDLETLEREFLECLNRVMDMQL